MRRGRVFRRCTSCKARVTGRRCAKCGGERTTWAFVVDIEPPGAPRRQVMRAGFATKGEAEAEKARLQQDKEEGRYVEPSRLTLRQYLEDWIAKLDQVRPTTHGEWSGHVRNHLVPRLGSIGLQQLTAQHIRAFYAELRRSGHQRTKAGLSPKSVWNVHLCLTRAMNDAVKDKLLPANPARGTVKPPRERPVIDFWTSVEFAVFLAWLDRKNDGGHDLALYQLAVQTGMRRGELLGLRWSEVDLGERRLTIIGQLYDRRRGEGQFGPPKTRASSRTVDLSTQSVAALTSWREAHGAQRAAWAELYQDGGLVFCRANGDSHDPRAVSKDFRKQVAAAGIKRIRFHDLRHTSAVIGLRELGESPDEVSKRLGHESTAFTLDTYGHLLPHRGKEVATAFDTLVEQRRAT